MRDSPIVAQRTSLRAKLERYEAGLARGRQLGADVQKIAKALRESKIEMFVRDLLHDPDIAKWRPAAIVAHIFERQRDIGLRQFYAFTTLDRIVRRSIAKIEHDSQSDT